MSLRLSLGIVATGISQGDNGGAVCVSGVNKERELQRDGLPLSGEWRLYILC